MCERGGGGRWASLTSTLISGTQSTCCASVTRCGVLRGVGEIESKKSGGYESLNAHFRETAESYGLLKRFAVEYARFIRAPTLPNTFEQVGCSNLSASELCFQVLYEYRDKM